MGNAQWAMRNSQYKLLEEPSPPLRGTSPGGRGKVAAISAMPLGSPYYGGAGAKRLRGQAEEGKGFP